MWGDTPQGFATPRKLRQSTQRLILKLILIAYLTVITINSSELTISQMY